MAEANKSYYENSPSREKERLIEKKVLQLGSDKYEYLFVSPWSSLGTSIPSGETIEGITGPEIVISDQVQDLLDENPENGVPLAIVLHEFGHAGCGHNSVKEGSGSSDYSERETEANNWAIDLINKKYDKLPWANSAIKYLEDSNKSEKKRTSDLTDMLQNMDKFEDNMSPAIRESYPDLFDLKDDEATVELSSQETNELLDWLEKDLGTETDDYKEAIDFLRTEDKAESEPQIKMMLDLENKIDTQAYYWNEKHRGKGFAYKLIKKLIDKK